MNQKQKKSIDLTKLSIFKKNTLICTDIFFEHKVDFANVELSEADVDSKSVKTLIEMGWEEHKEIRQQRTSIAVIDSLIKSKSGKSRNTGHADIYVLQDDKLKVIIDNKCSKESVLDGIKDAIYYAECCHKGGYDVRIVQSYNGKESLLKVYNSTTGKWVSLLINGQEVKGFLSKELVNLIYSYKDLTNIIIKDSSESINVTNIIQELKEIYRNVSFLQNDNQKTIDFTISFIALKSILEKHGSKLSKSWSDLDVAEQKVLKERVIVFTEDIIDSLKTDYEEIFRIKADPKGKIKQFDFIDVIKQFPNKPDLKDVGHLIRIYKSITKLPHLHSSKLDLFGEVYQSLMDKHTRKIFGQFFTPRHLIKALIRLLYEEDIEQIIGEVKNNKPVRPKTICDPACGTGGFLTESFKYFVSYTQTKYPKLNTKLLAEKSLYGFDIYNANTVRSRINMYLAGDGFSRIDSLDTLRDLDVDSLKFDYIVTNPPFGKGDINVDKEIISNKRKEINFIITVIKLLRPGGKGLVIIPDGILEAPTLNKIREFILRSCEIEKIVGLPKHIFAPYTHEKTYAIYLKKRSRIVNDLNEIISERVWMYIIDNDGYANSDKRFRTSRKDKDGRWLHDELSFWKDNYNSQRPSIIEENWRKKTQDSSEKYYDEWGNLIHGMKYGYIEIQKIMEEKFISFPTLNFKEILKIIKAEKPSAMISKEEELYEELNEEEGVSYELKEEYFSILEHKEVIYDSFERKFFDESRPTENLLINLLPEKYLRPKYNKLIKLNEFYELCDKTVEQIKVDIQELINTITNED